MDCNDTDSLASFRRLNTGFYYSDIHPLTGTTSSGGGGSGGKEPKCFSSFIRCVKFMTIFC